MHTKCVQVFTTSHIVVARNQSLRAGKMHSASRTRSTSEHNRLYFQACNSDILHNCTALTNWLMEFRSCLNQIRRNHHRWRLCSIVQLDTNTLSAYPLCSLDCGCCDDTSCSHEYLRCPSPGHKGGAPVLDKNHEPLVKYTRGNRKHQHEFDKTQACLCSVSMPRRFAQINALVQPNSSDCHLLKTHFLKPMNALERSFEPFKRLMTNFCSGNCKDPLAVMLATGRWSSTYMEWQIPMIASNQKTKHGMSKAFANNSTQHHSDS